MLQFPFAILRKATITPIPTTAVMPIPRPRWVGVWFRDAGILCISRLGSLGLGRNLLGKNLIDEYYHEVK